MFIKNLYITSAAQVCAATAITQVQRDVCNDLCELEGPAICTDGSYGLDGTCVKYFIHQPSGVHCYSSESQDECPDAVPMSVAEAESILVRLSDRVIRTLPTLRYNSPRLRRRVIRHASSDLSSLPRWPDNIVATPLGGAVPPRLASGGGNSSPSTSVLGNFVSTVFAWIQGTAQPFQSPSAGVNDRPSSWTAESEFVGDSWGGVVAGQERTNFSDDGSATIVSRKPIRWEHLSAIERIQLFLNKYRGHEELGRDSSPPPTSFPLMEAYTDMLRKLNGSLTLLQDLEKFWIRVHGHKLLELAESMSDSDPNLVEVFVTLLTVVSELAHRAKPSDAWVHSLIYHVNFGFCSEHIRTIKRAIKDDYRSRLSGGNLNILFDPFQYQWNLEMAPMAFVNKACPVLVADKDVQLKSLVWAQRMFRKRVETVTPFRPRAIHNSDELDMHVLLWEVPRRPRHELVKASLSNLIRIPGKELIKEIKIVYAAEMGMDYGGLRHDWFSELTSALVFPDEEGVRYFEPCGNNRNNCVSFPKMAAPLGSDYTAIGKFVALSLVQGIPIGIRFPLSLWAFFFGRPMDMDDLKYDDPIIHKYYSDLLENKVDENKSNFFFDEAGNPISEANKHAFVVQTLANRDMEFRIPNSPAWFFVNGFKEVVTPEEMVDLFSGDEVNVVIEGELQIDPVDLLQHLQTHEIFHQSNEWFTRLEWFRNIIGAMNQSDLRALTQFFTGDSVTPVGGFRNLEKPLKFDPDVAQPGFNDKRLPSAKTCFNQLFIPFYSSQDVMKEQLLYAIHSESGFQMC